MGVRPVVRPFASPLPHNAAHKVKKLGARKVALLAANDVEGVRDAWPGLRGDVRRDVRVRQPLVVVAFGGGRGGAHIVGLPVQQLLLLDAQAAQLAECPLSTSDAADDLPRLHPLT